MQLLKTVCALYRRISDWFFLLIIFCHERERYGEPTRGLWPVCVCVYREPVPWTHPALELQIRLQIQGLACFVYFVFFSLQSTYEDYIFAFFYFFTFFHWGFKGHLLNFELKLGHWNLNIAIEHWTLDTETFELNIWGWTLLHCVLHYILLLTDFTRLTLRGIFLLLSFLMCINKYSLFFIQARVVANSLLIAELSSDL